MNAFAKALNEGKFYVGRVCDDCQSVLVNGDASGNDRDWDETEFNRVVQKYEITQGHPCTLTEWNGSVSCVHLGEPCPDDDDCSCAETDLSTSQCDGCGTWLHGARHDFIFIERSDMEG